VLSLVFAFAGGATGTTGATDFTSASAVFLGVSSTLTFTSLIALFSSVAELFFVPFPSVNPLSMYISYTPFPL